MNFHVTPLQPAPLWCMIKAEKILPSGGTALETKEKSIRFLALRALVVTIVVLLVLLGFDRLNITSIGEDVPRSAVEQCINET